MSKITEKTGSIEGLTVSATVLGELLSVTDRRVRQLAEEGIFRRVSKGRYLLPDSIKTYINMLKMENDIAASGGNNNLDLETEKAIHERIKRQQSEIKLALMRGEVHKSEDVEEVMTDMLASFRSKMMSLPSKLAPLLLNKSEATTVREVLTREILEVLMELKDYNPYDFYGEEYIEYDEGEVDNYEKEENHT
ncbi:hypothetical protein [Cellulosilyticum sp. WCF-2]|uniref:hypothetical protein n=1 Tax=Cellulosilyticum sp. WCF-2 TaxID=2497860 RepID=UPI000F8ED994|nr:hypothetical protein [Cellulosilyticum sp. WCF-2]QEH67276.1 hypothetical protein EKH84_02025 [Cellulosilyticum sp. WCF-2]